MFASVYVAIAQNDVLKISKRINLRKNIRGSRKNCEYCKSFVPRTIRYASQLVKTLKLIQITCIYFDTKMATDSVSKHLFFKIFLGHAPRPPSISMLCMLIVLHPMECIFRCPGYPYALLLQG